MQLILPTFQYKSTFLQGLFEYQQEGRYLEYPYNFVQQHFDLFLTILHNKAKGINLPVGHSPEHFFWLIDAGEFIGITSIRTVATDWVTHEGGHIGYSIRPSKRNKGYGKNILRLVLPKAKEFGFEKVLITCDENNIGSKKIIETNGGVFEKSVFLSAERPYKLHYWIQV